MTPFMKAVLCNHDDCWCSRCQADYKRHIEALGTENESIVWMNRLLDYEMIYEDHQKAIWKILDGRLEEITGTWAVFPLWGIDVEKIKTHADFCKAMVTAAAQVAGKGEGK